MQFQIVSIIQDDEEHLFAWDAGLGAPVTYSLDENGLAFFLSTHDDNFDTEDFAKQLEAARAGDQIGLIGRNMAGIGGQSLTTDEIVEYYAQPRKRK